MYEFWGEKMKHELLSPAGDMECLRQAVYNGADAVYVAAQNFGARKFAKNFTNEELVEAIKFCHLYNVRLYVTMNTLVKDEEVKPFIDQARFLHQHGVDALIVQDFGMINLLRETFPNLEIHASTQANNSSKETCKLFYDLGVKRVVLSRELSIDEIDNIDVPIEKEAFIHGALCISYSGCCLMSSMLGGRSGNRGECAGSCRLKYSLLEDNKIINKDKYLLSTKELNTSKYFDRLLNSSIYSFKIEGRMKSPLYVAFITRLYRRIIDKEQINLKEEIDKLKTIFNREFTLGRILKANDIELMNTKSPNHIGLEIGKAIPKKDKIKLILNSNRELSQNDAIRFLNSNKGMIVNYLYDNNLKLTNKSNNICYVDNKIGLDSEDILTKTQDYNLEKEYIRKDAIRKTPINIKIIAHKNKELVVSFNDIEVKGNIIEEAKTYPTTKESIIEKITKLGNTPFIANHIEIEMDNNIFIQVKQLNDMKRELIEKLINEKENIKTNFIEKSPVFEKHNELNKNPKITCTVYNEDQLKECLDTNIERIYVRNKILYDMYSKYNNIYLFENRCEYDYSNLHNKTLISDYLKCNGNIVGNYTLNVTNIYSAYYIKQLGLKNIPLSCELNEYEINKLVNDYCDKFGNDNFEILAYGRVENMIIKGNILNIIENKYNYTIQDIKDRKFPVYYDGVKTHILNYENKTIDNNIHTNITYRLDFYNETKEEIKEIIRKYKVMSN